MIIHWNNPTRHVKLTVNLGYGETCSMKSSDTLDYVGEPGVRSICNAMHAESRSLNEFPIWRKQFEHVFVPQNVRFRKKVRVLEDRAKRYKLSVLDGLFVMTFLSLHVPS